MAPRKISIGTLSKETNIPVSTIRTWENRYGVPEASGRTKGNHRLYDVDVIDHLKLINQALQINTRASEVVPLSLEELHQICRTHYSPREDEEICAWLQQVHELDERGLHSSWQKSLNTLGLEQFILQKMIPFVQLIGEEWNRGEVHIFEEHFATEKILDFLSNVWRSINKHNQGDKVVLAALPNEVHTLGLHFAACFLVLHGFDVVFLGTNTPQEEIVRCVRKTNAKTIVFSVSGTYNQQNAKTYLRELQENVPQTLKIVVGGRGAPRDMAKMMFCPNLSELVVVLNQPTS